MPPKTRILHAPRRPTIRLGALTDELRPPATGGEYEGSRFTGDLGDVRATGAYLLDSEIADARAGTFDLRGARLADTRVRALGATSMKAGEANLRDVEFDSCRIGALDLSGAWLLRVVLRGVKAEWVNLRGAEVTDLTIENCTIADLDLGGATITRLTVSGDIAAARLHDGRFTHVDLHAADLTRLDGLGSLAGVTLSPDQARGLGPALVRHLGGNLTEEPDAPAP